MSITIADNINLGTDSTNQITITKTALTSGNAGALIIEGGAGHGNGGDLTLGAGSSTYSGNGGHVRIDSGSGNVGTDGEIQIGGQAGNLVLGADAAFTITRPLASAGGNSLIITGQAGDGTNNKGGNIIINGGESSGTGTGNGGNVVIDAGNKLDTGLEGEILIGTTYASEISLGANTFVTGDLDVTGALSKGTGTFKISHPLPSKTDTHYLLHSFIEGPKADLIYRGVLTLQNGTGSVNIDDVSNMTSGTFEVLCGDVQCFTTNECGWDLVKGSVSGATLTITSRNSSSTDTINWMVIGERKDPYILSSNITNNEGHIIVEKEKP